MFADEIIFKSEAIPNKKIKKKVILKFKLKFKKNNKEQKITPPIKGIFSLVTNVWCFSPEKLNNNLFFIQNLFKNMTRKIRKIEIKKIIFYFFF